MRQCFDGALLSVPFPGSRHSPGRRAVARSCRSGSGQEALGPGTPAAGFGEPNRSGGAEFPERSHVASAHFCSPRALREGQSGPVGSVNPMSYAGPGLRPKRFAHAAPIVRRSSVGASVKKIQLIGTISRGFNTDQHVHGSAPHSVRSPRADAMTLGRISVRGPRKLRCVVYFVNSALIGLGAPGKRLRAIEQCS